MVWCGVRGEGHMERNTPIIYRDHSLFYAYSLSLQAVPLGVAYF